MSHDSNQKPTTEDNNPIAAQVREQLARVLNSQELRASKRLSSLLRYVVDETLAGREDRLKAYTIALEAFGCEADFDPQTNPMVRIHAAKLRRASERYYFGAGATDPLRIELPKGAYIPVFTAQAPVTPAVEPISRPTIAVLPLVNLDPAQGEDFFAYGLGEELSTQLALIQGLTVIAHYSTQAYRDIATDLKRIGRELGARYLVTGSVLKTPERLRLALQLNDAESQQQVWGQRYDIVLAAADLFQMQDDIERAVISQIADHTSAFEQVLWKASRRKPVSRLTAYEAVLRFHHYDRHLSAELAEPTRAALEHAIAIEPEYALAWAMLSNLYTDMYSYEYGDRAKAAARATECAHHALALDPACQFAHFAMAWQAVVIAHDSALAIRSAERIIELNPRSAFMCAAAGETIAMAGEMERGTREMEAALRLIPHPPGWMFTVPAIRDYLRGDFTRALDTARKINTPDFPWDPILRTACLAQLGRAEEAKAALAHLLARKPDFAEDPRFLVGQASLVDGLIEQVLDGLYKAGLDSGRQLAPILPHY